MNNDFRRINLLVGVLFFWASTCSAQQQPEASAKQGLTELKTGAGPAPASVWDFMSRNPRIENTLKAQTEVNFTDIPLMDAMNYLKELHHIDIWIDRKALSEEAISTDSPVTLEMSGVSLKSVLKLLLEPLELEGIVQREILVITTRTVADQTFENRVYNTARLPDLSPKDLLEIITTIVEPNRWHRGHPAEPQAPAKAVTSSDVIELHNVAFGPHGVETETPKEPAKGTGCAIANTLVIHQTRRIHEQIVELLEQLERQQMAQQAKPTAR